MGNSTYIYLNKHISTYNAMGLNKYVHGSVCFYDLVCVVLIYFYIN